MKLFEEILDENEKRLSRLEQAVVNLIKSDMEAMTSSEKLSEEFIIIRKAQKKTDERLNALILTVEKFLEDKNKNGDGLLSD